MALPFQSALKHKVRWKTVDVIASLDDECVGEGGMCSAKPFFFLSYTSATEEITGVKENNAIIFLILVIFSQKKKELKRGSILFNAA